MTNGDTPFQGGGRPDPETIKAWLRARPLPRDLRESVPRDSLELLQSERRKLVREFGFEVVGGRRRATLRFYGESIAKHEMPVSVAATLIGDFQSLITAIAEQLRNAAILQLPQKEQRRQRREIKVAVDLIFSPNPTAGSAVFHLWEPVVEPSDAVPGQQEFSGDVEHPLVDTAVGKAFDIFEAAARENPDEAGLKESLRELGMKHAGKLELFARHLISQKVQVDLVWGAPELPKRKAHVRHREAAYLRQLVHAESERTEVVQLSGTLQTISTIRKVDLELPNGKIITAETTEYVAQLGLAKFYERRVMVLAEVRRVWSDATNSVKENYLFRHIELDENTPPTAHAEMLPF